MEVQCSCPVCDATVTLVAGTEVSEIISCPDCDCRLVVTEISADSAQLEQAPEIQEDWGE